MRKPVVALLGRPNVGKSTLFKCLLGLSASYEGKITINGESTAGIPPERLAKLVAYIPQSHDTAFNLSVFDMVLMGTTAGLRGFRMPSQKESEITCQALKRLGILSLKDRDYQKISGGERQLVLIARALAQQTKVLIMDEPTANLDYGNSLRVLDQMKSLARQGYTILFSTHITSDLEHIADQIIFIDQGKILLNQSRDELLDNYGILKCGLKEFEQVDPKDYLYYKKGKYQCEMLVKEKHKIQKKYKNMVMDPITLEELMILTIKGVKSC